MAFLETLLLLLISFVIFFFFWSTHRRLNNNGGPTNWPVVGMLPALVYHLHSFNEWVVDTFRAQSVTNFVFKGPWFSKLSEMLITVDPVNIHYITTSNFENYPKGDEFRETFDIFGSSLFIVDGLQWKNHRRAILTLLSQRKISSFVEKISRDKVKSCLMPILDRALKETGTVVDLQDLFSRYTFDSICWSVTGFDPGSLSGDVPFTTALDDIMEAIFHRQIAPQFVWKLQRWVGVGTEKKLMRAWKTSDKVIAGYINKRRQQLLQEPRETDHDEEGIDLLASCITMDKDEISSVDCTNDEFLRNTIFGLIVAGRDTASSGLTWFFWNLSRHLSVEKKIREEITCVTRKEELGPNTINKLVYLHAAICESLRLYPPVHSLGHKRSLKPDILPSGHVVTPKTRILFCLYVMARMPSIWGEDCTEFKPERWINDKGGIKHVPAFKFPVFAAGPRSCLGKEWGLTQMKMVAATIIRKFHFEVVEGHDAEHSRSIVLSMKNGLKVRVSDATCSSD